MTPALWCVLAAAVLPYLTVAVAKALAPYDNRDPRRPGTYAGLAYRAHSAHQNGFEVFPFFAAAVFVAGHGATGTHIPLLDVLAGLWLGLRLIYVAAYLADYAALRSLVWIAAFFLTIGIFTMPAWHG